MLEKDGRNGQLTWAETKLIFIWQIVAISPSPDVFENPAACLSCVECTHSWNTPGRSATISFPSSLYSSVISLLSSRHGKCFLGRSPALLFKSFQSCCVFCVSGQFFVWAPSCWIYSNCLCKDFTVEKTTLLWDSSGVGGHDPSKKKCFNVFCVW
jgi:hypothetical protein